MLGRGGVLKLPQSFGITPSTRDALEAWIKYAGLNADEYLPPSCLRASPHLGIGGLAPASRLGGSTNNLLTLHSDSGTSQFPPRADCVSKDVSDCPTVAPG